MRRSGWGRRPWLIEKSVTMTVKGGMTPHYQGDWRYKIARVTSRSILRLKHNEKWTVQHQVDYRPFRKNKLRLKPGIVISEGVNNYGMKLVS